jgi:Na+/H+ antiporter NhaC
MDVYYIIILFILGTIFGSFYNVVGDRLPEGKSIVKPSSHCPKCQHKLTPLELIPIFSFLFQKGKCKGCKCKIPIMHPLFELGSGILFAGLIGLFTNSFDLLGLISAISNGIVGMQEICILVIIVGGVVSLIKFNGGIDFLLHFITKRIKSKKGAEFGIAVLVSIIDLCTANNTIAIVTAGPLAKDISEEYDIDSRKSASILDIFSSCWQGIIPYGAQLLTASSIVGISTIEILKYLYYPWLMLVFGLISIFFGIPALKKSKLSDAKLNN